MNCSFLKRLLIFLFLSLTYTLQGREDHLSLELTSEELIEADQGELVFVSALMTNQALEILTEKVVLTAPDKWHVLSSSSEITLSPGSSSLQIFGVKIPSNVLAGEYLLSLKFDNSSQEKKIKIIVKPIIELSARTYKLPENIVAGEPVSFEVLCHNKGNMPLNIRLAADGEPICCLSYNSASVTLLPEDCFSFSLELIPQVLADETKQFIIINIFDDNTDEMLQKLSLCFNILPPGTSEDDPFHRIPSNFSTIAVGENGQHVFVLELMGEGILDKERDRYLKYCLRLPSMNRNVLYNVDQRIYFSLSESHWDLTLGDTVYSLTPLTQRYRYGRGAGFSIELGNVAAGAHYTQNTFSNCYNPKETCAFIEYGPSEMVNFSANYLHKNLKDIPKTNILTLASKLEPFSNCALELEAGADFLKKRKRDKTLAYRAEGRGRWRDYWFDIAKIFAGSNFFGYYQHMSLFSSTVNFPITAPLRANISYTQIEQNFDCLGHDRDFESMNPWQRQYNAALSYQFTSGLNISLNGSLLRAKDRSVFSSYNFYQKWGGGNLSFFCFGCAFNANVSFGKQIDYLTNRYVNSLQSYYIYLSKDITDKFFASFFYEGGNINYFDAKPWRTTYGASFRYRYTHNSWLEMLVQQTNYKPVRFSQININWHHQFKNMHQLNVCAQQFYYRNSYQNDVLYLVSYTIPFGMPVSRKLGQGGIEGIVYDTWNNCPVPNVLLSANGKNIKSNEQGRFIFPHLTPGMQNFKPDYLPDPLIARDLDPAIIQIKEGEMKQVNICVVPSSCIKGTLILYEFEDAFVSLENPILVEQRGMEGVRITIDRDNGKEIYSILTDKNGDFLFPKLRPGSWQIYVTEQQIPRLHQLTINDFAVDLTPGEEKLLLLKVVPQERHLHPIN